MFCPSFRKYPRNVSLPILQFIDYLRRRSFNFKHSLVANSANENIIVKAQLKSTQQLVGSSNCFHPPTKFRATYEADSKYNHNSTNSQTLTWVSSALRLSLVTNEGATISLRYIYTRLPGAVPQPLF